MPCDINSSDSHAKKCPKAITGASVWHQVHQQHAKATRSLPSSVPLLALPLLPPLLTPLVHQPHPLVYHWYPLAHRWHCQVRPQGVVRHRLGPPTAGHQLSLPLLGKEGTPEGCHCLWGATWVGGPRSQAWNGPSGGRQGAGFPPSRLTPARPSHQGRQSACSTSALTGKKGKGTKRRKREGGRDMRKGRTRGERRKRRKGRRG